MSRAPPYASYGSAETMYRRIYAVPKTIFPGVPPLASVAISGVSFLSVAARGLHLCDACSSSLTNLSLSMDKPQTWKTSWDLNLKHRVTHPLYEKLTQSISRCSILHRLNLDCLCEIAHQISEKPCASAMFEESLCPSIKTLTSLTALQLGARFEMTIGAAQTGDVCWCGHALGKAIVGLTGLRVLSLGHGVRRDHTRAVPAVKCVPLQPVLDALAHLRLLTALQLQLEGLSVDDIAPIVGNLPELRKLSVRDLAGTSAARKRPRDNLENVSIVQHHFEDEFGMND